jgi:hypothetical protein
MAAVPLLGPATSDEPSVTVTTEQFVKIAYDGKYLCMPAREAVDLIRPLAKLLPDDAGVKSTTTTL